MFQTKHEAKNASVVNSFQCAAAAAGHTKRWSTKIYILYTFILCICRREIWTLLFFELEHMFVVEKREGISWASVWRLTSSFIFRPEWAYNGLQCHRCRHPRLNGIFGLSVAIFSRFGLMEKIVITRIYRAERECADLVSEWGEPNYCTLALLYFLFFFFLCFSSFIPKVFGFRDPSIFFSCWLLVSLRLIHSHACIFR